MASCDLTSMSRSMMSNIIQYIVKVHNSINFDIDRITHKHTYTHTHTHTHQTYATGLKNTKHTTCPKFGKSQHGQRALKPCTPSR